MNTVPAELSVRHERERDLIGGKFAADADGRAETDGMGGCIESL